MSLYFIIRTHKLYALYAENMDCLLVIFECSLFCIFISFPSFSLLIFYLFQFSYIQVYALNTNRVKIKIHISKKPCVFLFTEGAL